MNKILAKRIAESISNDALKLMLDAAKENIKDWTVISDVNKGMTKGATWNILGRNFDTEKKYHSLVKTNMIREFGDYLPDSYKTKFEVKKFESPTEIFHQEPIEDDIERSMTGSKIGSHHWFVTLLSSHARIGEYFINEGAPDEALLKEWGKILKDSSNHIIRNLPKIIKE